MPLQAVILALCMPLQAVVENNNLTNNDTGPLYVGKCPGVMG